MKNLSPPIRLALQSYGGQDRIAQMIKKKPVKSVQGQVDRVSISVEGLNALTSHKPQHIA